MIRPNIVYLHPADIGTYVEPYGYPVSTPNMQRIAERGVTFRNAFCTSPSCSPLRAALLTGQYPLQNGMIALTHHACLLNDYRKHMVHTFKAARYTTLPAGHQHVHPLPSQFVEDGRPDSVTVTLEMPAYRYAAAEDPVKDERLDLGAPIEIADHSARWVRFAKAVDA